MKLALGLITIFVVVSLSAGLPVPSKLPSYSFDRDEVVIPVPIVYTGNEHSFENILNTGTKTLSQRSSEGSVKKPTAVSKTQDEDNDDDDDEADIDDDDEDDPDASALQTMRDAAKERENEKELDDGVDILVEGQGKPNDDDDEDDDEEDDDDDDEGEKGGRKKRYLFPNTGINESYGWYGWPNEYNHNHHHSHNHHHHHQPTYHHGFYTSYF